MVDSKLISASLLLLISLFFLSGVVRVSSDLGSGAFTFTVDGYAVTGDLTGASIGHDGTIQMLMSIDQTVSTSYGTVYVTGNGVWNGQTDFNTISGVIENVTGTAKACAVFYCQSVDFTGQGTWSGTAAWSDPAGLVGSGMFQGTLNFTGQQLNQTKSVPVSGNWTATFET
jgi:hypothetical protein